MAGRLDSRKIRRLPVTIHDGVKEYRGTTSDMSHTGIFIRSRKIFKPGTPLKLVIEIDETRKISLLGIVKRFIKLGTTVFKDGLGIELTSIPQEYKDLVEDLLKK
jgi:Tfp pilus assembly protein PilZ